MIYLNRFVFDEHLIAPLYQGRYNNNNDVNDVCNLYLLRHVPDWLKIHVNWVRILL